MEVIIGNKKYDSEKNPITITLTSKKKQFLYYNLIKNKYKNVKKMNGNVIYIW